MFVTMNHTRSQDLREAVASIISMMLGLLRAHGLRGLLHLPTLWLVSREIRRIGERFNALFAALQAGTLTLPLPAPVPTMPERQPAYSPRPRTPPPRAPPPRAPPPRAPPQRHAYAHVPLPRAAAISANACPRNPRARCVRASCRLPHAENRSRLRSAWSTRPPCKKIPFRPRRLRTANSLRYRNETHSTVTLFAKFRG